MAKLKILVAAHSPLFNRSLGNMVGRGGYEAVQANDGDSIRALYRDGAVDLCLLQDTLPSGSGLELCAELTAEPHPHPPPIVVFSRAAGVEEDAMRGGASGFLRVPCQPGEILDLVGRWLAMEAASDGDAHTAETGTPPPAKRAGHQTVLLVDDSKLIHSYVQSALDGTYELVSAYDGEEGFRKALEVSPDLIISDIDMPRMNGFEMCRRVKETEAVQNVPILILSARGASVDLERGFAVGANDYLTKPVDEDELRSRVALMLGGESQRELVLVVEDSMVQRNLIVQGMAQQGFEVVAAENGRQGLDMAFERTPDLVVTDLEMPVMDGMELTRQLKRDETLRDVPVVMLTAYDSEQERDKGLRSGVSAYLGKPFSADKIVVIVEKLLGDRRIKELERMNEILEQRVAERTAELAEANGQLEAARRRLELQVRELDGRDRLERLHMSSLAVENAYEIVLEVITDVFRTERAVIYRSDGPEGGLRAAAAIGLEGKGTLSGTKALGSLSEALEPAGVLVGRSCTEGRPIDGGEGAAAPILQDDEISGALWVSRLPDDEVGSDVLLETLWRLARATAAVLGQAAMNSALDRGEVDVSALLEVE